MVRRYSAAVGTYHLDAGRPDTRVVDSITSGGISRRSPITVALVDTMGDPDSLLPGISPVTFKPTKTYGSLAVMNRTCYAIYPAVLSDLELDGTLAVAAFQAFDRGLKARVLWRLDGPTWAQPKERTNGRRDRDEGYTPWWWSMTTATAQAAVFT